MIILGIYLRTNVLFGSHFGATHLSSGLRFERKLFLFSKAASYTLDLRRRGVAAFEVFRRETT